MVLLEVLNIPLSWNGAINGSTIVAVLVFFYNIKRGVKAKATKEEVQKYIDKHETEHKSLAEKEDIREVKEWLIRVESKLDRVIENK